MQLGVVGRYFPTRHPGGQTTPRIGIMWGNFPEWEGDISFVEYLDGTTKTTRSKNKSSDKSFSKL